MRRSVPVLFCSARAPLRSASACMCPGNIDVGDVGQEALRGSYSAADPAGTGTRAACTDSTGRASEDDRGSRGGNRAVPFCHLKLRSPESIDRWYIRAQVKTGGLHRGLVTQPGEMSQNVLNQIE